MSALAVARALRVLRCPRCDGAFTLEQTLLRCTNGHRFAWRDGYFDLDEIAADDATARTFESFGYEWTTFDEPEPEDDISSAVYFADIEPESLRGVSALDAGCGRGRFTKWIAEHAGTVVALDGSAAVEAAARNLAAFDNVVVFRGDLRHPPVAEGALGFVACLGVLHHLRDPAEGLRALVRLLEPDGRILVYVYSAAEERGVRAFALRASTAMRRVTTRTPHRLLRALCVPMSLVLSALFVWPGRLGDKLKIGPLRRLPLNAYRPLPWRALWLDTFDRLSAPVEHRFRRDELEPWFATCGLQVHAVREHAGYYVVGQPAPVG